MPLDTFLVDVDHGTPECPNARASGGAPDDKFGLVTAQHKYEQVHQPHAEQQKHLDERDPANRDSQQQSDALLGHRGSLTRTKPAGPRGLSPSTGAAGEDICLDRRPWWGPPNDPNVYTSCSGHIYERRQAGYGWFGGPE
jgi:hypothetical protein